MRFFPDFFRLVRVVCEFFSCRGGAVGRCLGCGKGGVLVGNAQCRRVSAPACGFGGLYGLVSVLGRTVILEWLEGRRVASLVTGRLLGWVAASGVVASRFIDLRVPVVDPTLLSPFPGLPSRERRSDVLGFQVGDNS